MYKDEKYWQEEYKKCISSAYYFYINYVMIETKNGLQKTTTRMTEEEFNRAYSGMKEEDFILKKGRR